MFKTNLLGSSSVVVDVSSISLSILLSCCFGGSTDGVVIHGGLLGFSSTLLQDNASASAGMGRWCTVKHDAEDEDEGEWEGDGDNCDFCSGEEPLVSCVDS